MLVPGLPGGVLPGPIVPDIVQDVSHRVLRHRRHGHLLGLPGGVLPGVRWRERVRDDVRRALVDIRR